MQISQAMVDAGRRILPALSEAAMRQLIAAVMPHRLTFVDNEGGSRNGGSEDWPDLMQLEFHDPERALDFGNLLVQFARQRLYVSDPLNADQGPILLVLGGEVQPCA